MKPSKTIIVKVGSASLVDEKTFQPKISVFKSVAELLVILRNEGHKVILVSSGAVAVGKGMLRWSSEIPDPSRKRALAAVGQTRLMKIWEEAFSIWDICVAQVLLLNDNHLTSSKGQVGDMLQSLLLSGVVPIINENDAIAPGTFGGNDMVALLAAKAIKADTLVFLTDIDCLYTKNPRLYPDAKPIELVADCDNLSVDVSSRGTELGTGGMETKLLAARLAASLGMTTIINNVSNALNVSNVINHMIYSANPYLKRQHSSLRTSNSSSDDCHRTDQSARTDRHSLLLHTKILPALTRRDMLLQQLIAVSA